MSHFFGLLKSNLQSCPDNSHLNKSYIQPDEDDIWSQREIESQRTKWKAFLKSRSLYNTIYEYNLPVIIEK